MWHKSIKGEEKKDENQANKDKMPSAEKGLFCLWDILKIPHGNHKTYIYSTDTQKKEETE